jgi:uncharacterized protein
MPNRLANETSPYLLQHRDNPVEWYPWGEDALRRAREEDRPILLSVGYSACHWCHVMEHESFEDPETARLMNAHFVNVKVDREERPDIDSIYMSAVQQMTGHGGWPMTVFLTPGGVPFYGGTYFPPEPRHGLPSFRQLLLAVSEAYRDRRAEIDRSAETLRQMLEHGTALRIPAATLGPEIPTQAYQGIATRFDPAEGGFGNAPKFPQAMVLGFLLRHARRAPDTDALEMAEQTLRRMSRGGIYDHIGGGFHRYSVDARWLVPHFEKMLYDNALLSRAYLEAFLATGNEEYRVVAEDVLRYVVREMTSPEGAFYSTQDADSEGEEGRFYVWTPAEIERLLGPEDGVLFSGYYGVTEAGNFEGRNILHVRRGLEEAADELGVAPTKLRDVLTRGRDLLYRARAERVWPGRDEKVITAWNAMMLRSFAEAGFALGNEHYLAAARANAEFLLQYLHPEARLLRTYKDGAAKIEGFLEDHALMVHGLISLYQATFEPRWLDEARRLADQILERFWEPAERAFYDAAVDAEKLVVRPRDVNDTATPSGSSAAAVALLHLAALTGVERYRAVAVESIEAVGSLVTQLPLAFGELLSALEFHLADPCEVVVVGTPGDLTTERLLDVLRRQFLPHVVRAFRDVALPEAEAAPITPLLAGRTGVDGAPAAYVCHRFACRRPVTEPEALASALS